MEEYWARQAEKAWDNDPTEANWEAFALQVAACRARFEADLEEAKDGLARLERLAPDLCHKAKNRENYSPRSACKPGFWAR